MFETSQNYFNLLRIVLLLYKCQNFLVHNNIGLEAYGVGSDPQKYAGQIYRELREILARNKDFDNSPIITFA